MEGLMDSQYICGTEQRRTAVAESNTLNGIDYLEVDPNDQTRLFVHFVHDLPGTGSANTVPRPPAPDLTPENITISGGTRITGVQVTAVRATGNILTVTTDRVGDFSTYTLRLVDPSGSGRPPDGYDRQLAAIDFSFRVNCPSEFDCRPVTGCPPTTWPEPEIDYRAKDYNSFLQLMLDRLAVLMPDWQERHAADVQMALLELLAYTGDYLSYYQDVVATEAYLRTARYRTSVRRHARLVDYFMHDGSNARAWVRFQIDPGADGTVLPGPALGRVGLTLATANPHYGSSIAATDLDDAVSSGSLVFELLQDLAVYHAHNQMTLYTWSDDDCCLPQGATRATLKDDAANRLRLRPGDVLIFAEMIGPETGAPADADPLHRHAVRLTAVSPAATVHPQTQQRDPGPMQTDTLTGQPIVDIAWAAADALPFALCISGVSDAEHKSRPLTDISVVWGNVALSDHGQTVSAVQGGHLVPRGEKVPRPVAGQYYRPPVSGKPVTQQGQVPNPSSSAVLRTLQPYIPFDPAAPAAAALQWDLQAVHPVIWLDEQVAGGPPLTWAVRRDLLNSLSDAAEFVAEVEEDGTTFLRFGDNELGRRPDPSTDLQAFYRIGTGTGGNVGRETITHIVAAPPGVTAVTNPLPAIGGVDRQPLEEVRLFAPQAFRVQERAVTLDDYAEIAQRHPGVRKAMAAIRWTGSWYTYHVTVERQGGLPVDQTFKDDMSAYLQRYRVAGYELEVESPTYVPLDLALLVCVKPGYFALTIKEALLVALSNRDLGGGRRGFFYPDNFTFGQPLYLSQIYAAVMAVPGVESVQVRRFERWGKGPQGELESGILQTGRTEVIRLENDPNFAENGRLQIDVVGDL
jgi:hypothetical protein